MFSRMLRHPPQQKHAGPAEPPTRDHPIPMSIPAGLALKKECIMDKAAFALLETLAESHAAALEREQKPPHDSQLRFHLAGNILQLRDLLDKARHEQKGGA